MKFAATFQLKYNHDDEVHSVLPEITGHSYHPFEAESWDEAYLYMANKFKSDYAFLYEFDLKFERQIVFYDLHPVVFANEEIRSAPWPRDPRAPVIEETRVRPITT